MLKNGGSPFRRQLSVVVSCTFWVVATYTLVAFHASPVWNDADHSRKECRTVAEIASQVVAESRLKRLGTVEFASVLAGSPFTALPPHLTTTGNFNSIGCSADLAGRDLAVVHSAFPHLIETVALDPPIPYERYSFSRIAFWNGGNTAALVVTVWCGNLCATGSETLWRHENGRWVKIQERLVWIS